LGGGLLGGRERVGLALGLLGGGHFDDKANLVLA